MKRILSIALLALAACGAPAIVDPPPVPYHPFDDPGNVPHPALDPAWDAGHYRIEVWIDTTQTIRGTTSIEVSPMKGGDLVLEAPGLNVSSVTINGASADFSSADGKLRVASKAAATVTVNYTATPKHGLWRVEKPWIVWSQGETEYNAHWFPCWTSPADKATSEVIAHVPPGMTAISNGKLAEQRDGLWHWKQDDPHSSYLVTLVVGDYEKVELGGHKVPIDVWVPRGMYAVEDVKRTFAHTPAMVTWLEQKTGIAYPWAKYAQVIVKDFIWGGMENTSATTLYEHAVVPAALADERDMDDLIVHELAHQWFGDLVTCASWSELWLNEGFASYVEALWAEREGAERLDEVMAGFAEGVLDEQERYARPLVTDRYTHPDDMFDAHSYQKGAWVLHMLRCLVGDADFWKGMNLYLTRHRAKAVTTAHFRQAMEEASGRKLGDFFAQWVHKGGVPELEVTTTWDEPAKALRVAIEQKSVFVAPLEIEVTTAKGTKLHRVPLEAARQDFYFLLDGEPALVEIDPRGRLLKKVTWTRSHDELIALLEKGGLASRAWAAAQLAESPDPIATTSLRRAVLEDRPAVQQEAAKALAEIDDEALIEILKTAKARLRRIVFEALGGCANEEGVIEALRAGTQDASPLCRAAAWASMGKRAASHDELTVAATRLPDDDWVKPGILAGLMATEDDRAIETFDKSAQPGRPTRVRVRAVEGLGARKAQAKLVPLVDDGSYQVRMAAADALGECGDSVGAEVLERRLKLEVDGQLIQSMRRAVRKIRSR